MRLIPPPHSGARTLLDEACARLVDRARTRTRPGVRPLGLARVFVIVAAVVVFGVCSGVRAYAADLVAAPVGSVDQVLSNLRSWLVGILAGLATVFLTLGGVRYVMANGDPGEIEKAKSAFRGAGIGYGLAVLAPLVVSVLQGIVGG
jgi:hypothetical protein